MRRSEVNSMSSRHRAIALLLAGAMLSACSGPQKSQGRVDVVLAERENLVVLSLANNSAAQQTVSSGYAFAGVRGNIHAIIVSTYGELFPPCRPVDAPVEFWKASSIDAGKVVEIWSAAPHHIATFHCLKKGRYTLAFAYQRPNGELIVSNQVELVVSGELKSGSPFSEARLEMNKTPPMHGSD